MEQFDGKATQGHTHAVDESLNSPTVDLSMVPTDILEKLCSANPELEL